ncbi:MAG: M50 family metallopeptidase [Ignavibacteriales bacterium]|nr:M50 family metallopeptidase [Ignavibacteriales bacterium]
MAKTQNKNQNIIELVFLSFILIISFLFWDTYLVYPIKLFVVLIHEISHALSAILSGGKVIAFNIGFDLSGKCETESGNNILIATSGYLGSLLFGLLIFYSTYNKKIGKWLLIIISILILITSVSLMQNFSLILLAVLYSVLLFVSAFFLQIRIDSYILRLFGMLSCVYVLFDIKEDILSTNSAISDASILSELINVPTIMIGLIWLIISLAGIFLVMKLSYIQKSK